MKTDKKKIGMELMDFLKKEDDIKTISTWACNLFTSIQDNSDSELVNILRLISLIDAGPEFELTSEELYKLANELMEDGEKEELTKAIPEIKDIAIKIENNWLMCPLCQEAWESHSKYAMVFCPKCEHKLHNPKLLKS